MSLDVSFKYKSPKEAARRVACGSTVPLFLDDNPPLEEEWSANITHNMGHMASHVPIDNHSLYDYVWHGDEYVKKLTTDFMSDILKVGIAYMVSNRKELLKYNPVNNWGSYDAFLQWLINFKNACEDNPDCIIELDR